MSGPGASADDARVESILERWFEAEQTGEDVDLAELCGDAPHLLPRVRGMLERQQELLAPGERPAPAAAVPRSPLPIDRLGDFELKSRIGSGGMGDVYLAREVTLDRTVALKLLRRELTDDPVRRLRFKREAQLTAALDHPNIVPIYGTGEDQGHVFLVMKYLPGTTLDLVAGQLGANAVARVGARVARALEAAHAVGIVHRDIKPGNVQVNGDDVWVLDFGLARGQVDLTLTTDGQAPGTLAYMPPEQLRGDSHAINPRGDIYSLGATLYQCLVGRPPFEGDQPEALVRRVLVHDPAALRLPAGERDLETIVMRALDKEPGRRFATAGEFADDLERFLAGEPIQSRPPSTLTRAIKLASRHRVATASVAAAVLVALVLVPQLWRSANERASELDRQFGVVDQLVADGLPAMALVRVRELEQQDAAMGDPRLVNAQGVVQSALTRDALLDRVQLDSIYRHLVLDDEFVGTMKGLHSTVRAEPATAVALTFLSRAAGNAGVAAEHVAELRATGEFPRFVIAIEAGLAGRSAVDALAELAPAESTAEDHVFTAVTLRVHDAPASSVTSEIDAAFRVDPLALRARMMVGIQRSMAGDASGAREALTLAWDRQRPQVELHCMIAELSRHLGDADVMRYHLELAETARQQTGRPRNRWLELMQFRGALAEGDLELAEQLLRRSISYFGDDEWFQLGLARIELARDDVDAVRRLLERVRDRGQVDWNRRRARATLLQLDFRAWRERPTADGAEALITIGEKLAADAAAVDDWNEEVRARLVLHDLSRAMYVALLDRDPERAEVFENRLRAALSRVFEIDDLNEDATYNASAYALNVVTAAGSEETLVMGGFVEQIRRRAIAITDAGWAGRRRVSDPAAFAVFAAALSSIVNDRAAAERAGAIATHLLPTAGADQAELQRILDEAAARLDITDWPAPPPASRR